MDTEKMTDERWASLGGLARMTAKQRREVIAECERARASEAQQAERIRALERTLRLADETRDVLTGSLDALDAANNTQSERIRALKEVFDAAERVANGFFGRIGYDQATADMKTLAEALVHAKEARHG